MSSLISGDGIGQRRASELEMRDEMMTKTCTQYIWEM